MVAAGAAGPRHESAAVWAVCVAACVAGCAAPPAVPAPVAPMDVSVHLEVLADAPVPAGALFVSVLIEPTDGRDFVVQPVAHADGKRPPALLELTVSWQDFSGTRAVAVGRARSLVLDWAGSEPAAPGLPARIAAHLEVGETEGVLARRIVVEGRLIGVDLVRAEERSGGMVLLLPPAHVDACRPVPRGTLREHLQSGSTDGIFLAAVSAAPERLEEVLEALIEALPTLTATVRHAVFAALLYLTGETHGTDIHRWSTWWRERTYERGRTR